MKVCRTCLEVLNSDTSYVMVDADDCSMDCSPSIRSKLLQCVPELALDVVQCAVICTSCSNALTTAYDFKNKCLQTEEKILNYAQLTGCNMDSVNILEVVQFTNLNVECDPAEIKQQLAEVHYPITQIIEQDSDLDIKPIIGPCDKLNDESAPSSLYYYESGTQPVNIKVETDAEDQKIDMNNGMEKLLNPVFFSSELDVEVRGGYRSDGIEFFTQNIQLPEVNESSGGQNHECMYCQKPFQFLIELEAHLQTHMESRPLKCTMCERRFVRKDKLMLHMRIHTGEKPFKCTLCGRCFSRKDKLNNHMRTHTGEKPHQCILCQKCFARKDKMNTHMRSQHWLALANLEITVVKKEELTNVAETNVSGNASSQ